MAQGKVVTSSPYEDLSEIKLNFDSFTAASNGDLSYFTKCMIGSIENFSSANKSGWTPIMYACAKGHALLVSYLIMCGVKTNCASKSNVTPLMLAVSSGDLATVESVFQLSDVETKDYRKWTPLFYAVNFLQEKCVRFLLKKGANVNVQDFQNETPLVLAIKSGNDTIVELLLKKANNLDVISYKNESAVMLAKESNNPKIRDLVLNRKSHLHFGAPTPQKPPGIKLLKEDKENVYSPLALASGLAPGKSPRKRNFLGLKISKSFTYSPNKRSKSLKAVSQTNSPILNDPDQEKTRIWKMCIAHSPVPSTQQYDVEKLLSSLGLEKYWPIFRDEEVDFETLLTFSEENLKDLGITPFGPRKKILMAIKHLRIYDKR